MYFGDVEVKDASERDGNDDYDDTDYGGEIYECIIGKGRVIINYSLSWNKEQWRGVVLLTPKGDHYEGNATLTNESHEPINATLTKVNKMIDENGDISFEGSWRDEGSPIRYNFSASLIPK